MREISASPLADADIEDILIMAKASNEEVFAEIYIRYGAEVMRYIKAIIYFNRIGHLVEAKDILHDTFVRLLESVENIEKPESLKYWLLKTAKNALFSRLRENKQPCAQSSKPNLEESEDDSEPDIEDRAAILPEDWVINRELIGHAKHALDMLQPQERRALLLRRVEGYSVEETAKILGTESGGYVNKLVYTASKKLKKLFDEFSKDSQ